MDRRDFLKTSGMGIAAGALMPCLVAGTVRASESGDLNLPGLHLFSKHLHFLDYQGMAEAAANIGLAGLDLTVRKGGHVEPENFERDLP